MSSSHVSRRVAPQLVLIALTCLGLTGCDKLPTTMAGDATTVVEVVSDVAARDGVLPPSDAPDAPDARTGPAAVETTCMGTLAQGRGLGDRVVIDLCEYTHGSTATGAGVRRIEDMAEVLRGPAAQSRPGDYRLDTGVASFVVQGTDRHATPCPYGASVIDASYFGADGQGAGTPDNVGEVCLFLQIGRTIRPGPKSFEILADGSGGGPAILAVTSRDALSDWVSLVGLVNQYLGAVIDLAFDPEEELEMTITQYFIAQPGANALVYLTAIRNDSGRRQTIIGGDLVDSGGVVEFFNPASSLRGFGYSSMSDETLDFLAFAGEDSSFAYVPSIAAPAAQGDDGVRLEASYLAIAGVAAVILGTDTPMEVVISERRARDEVGIPKLDPFDVFVWRRQLMVGDEDLSSITDAIYAWRAQPTGTIDGQVVDAAGGGLEGVRVAAIKKGDVEALDRTETRFVTDADGRFSGTLPPGSYALYPDAPGRVALLVPTAEIVDGGAAHVEAKLGELGRLTVAITHGLDQSPIPGKISVLCRGTCPRPRSSLLRDVTFDSFEQQAAAIVYTGVDGTADISLPPGDYDVVVSRGPAWTVYPMGEPGMGPRAAAALVTVPESGSAHLDAVLYPAVDTSGYISADFHVHAINSPDAPVKNADRVRSFLAAGVNVLISTDHDYITDYAPVVRALGAEGVIATMVGVELTTFDYGHFNAFPLVVDVADIVGGAIDWAVDQGPPLHPAQVFAALESFPGEQVVQVNHASSGYLSFTRADVANRTSTANPETFRMDPVQPDSETGDTGLYVEDFTAMEVYNGYSQSAFWELMNWWFAMVSNGFVPLATASSDSHKLYTHLGGSPTTWIHVGVGKDSVRAFDPQQFVRAANDARGFGSNGPFVRYWATNVEGHRMDVGETIYSAGQTVTLHVEVSTPSWMLVDTVSLYGNVTNSSPPPGKTNDTPAVPLATASLGLTQDDLVGPERGNADAPLVGYRKAVTFEVTPTSDSFYIVTVSAGAGQPNMVPVLWSGVAPFAFTNPILVDVDGGGYDHPPMATRTDAGAGGAAPGPTRRAMTLEDFDVLRQKIEEKHGH